MEAIPPVNNKPKPKIPISLVIYLILGVSLAYFLFQNISLRKQSQEIDSLNKHLERLSNEVTKKEEEIKLCIEDKPWQGESIKKPYSFQELGLYSPGFKGREILFTTYEYKRNVIIRKSIQADEDTNQTWGIDVWELESGPSLSSPNNFPIFDGFENRRTPKWISERMANWEKQEEYTNEKGIKMHLAYGYAPKYIGAVFYEFYNQNSPSGNQSFVVIYNLVVGNNYFVSNTNDPAVVKAKQELNEIADKLSLREE